MEPAAARQSGAPAATAAVAAVLVAVLFLANGAVAWTGEIHGRVVCDVCGDSSIGPEDHALPGAEVAVLCIMRSGEVFNYQAFADSRGVYRVAETMPESDRWDSCMVRSLSSYHQQCVQRSGSHRVKFKYNRSSGSAHTVKPFLYMPTSTPAYCEE